MARPLLYHRILPLLILALLAYASDRPVRAQSTANSATSELAWANYLGGSLDDAATDIALDRAGNVYVTGYTLSIGWAIDSLGTSWMGKRDIFVTRISPAGEPVWNLFLGGKEDDQGNAIAVDGAGDIYVAGWTASIGWVSGGKDTSYNGYIYDGFVVKLSGAGQVLWGTYLGGNVSDSVYDLALDPQGNVLVAGDTNSAGWVSGGYDTSYGDGNLGGGFGDAFVAKISPAGQMLWSTYYGADKMRESVGGFAVDQAGNSILAVNITSCIAGDKVPEGGYLAKISSTGQLVWSQSWRNTYVLPFSDIWCQAIATDKSNNIYLAGYTELAGWTSGGYDTSYGGLNDGFVAKLTPDGQTLWSTYLGGNLDDEAYGLTVDDAGNVCVVGQTWSGGWLKGGFDTTLRGHDDIFVARLSPNGEHLWSARLGYENEDYGSAVAADEAGNLYLAGAVQFGSQSSFQWSPYVARILVDGALRVTLEPPAAAAAGVQWRRRGATLWRASGAVESDITSGTYRLEFRPVYGWLSPPPQTVTVTRGYLTQTSATCGHQTAVPLHAWGRY